MIRIEDAELVAFALSEGCIAVPFSVVRDKNGDACEITVYEPYLRVAEEFVRLYGEDPFSDGAIAYLREQLTVPMRAHGFVPSPDMTDRIRTFSIRPGEADISARIDPATRLVSGKDDLSSFCNMTTHAIEMDPDDPDDISAVIIQDGKLVAYATLNDVFDEGASLEISVECAVGYRGRGYASSCAALLAKELTGRGYTVLYKCRHVNAASARVAEKAGFAEASMEYNFVCYRED